MSYLAHLYPHVRIHQVFGANTDVGKTIFTTALTLASASLPFDARPHPQDAGRDANGYAIPHQQGESVFYLKPVSTGQISDADSHHISRFSPHTKARTLFQYEKPISPHLAALQSSQGVRTDREVVDGISNSLREYSEQLQGGRAAVFVETAGGVHSPAPSGTSMTALLRPMRLPTILIGDSQLGGISTTKSAYDSLVMAGYDVQALLLFSDASRGLGNADYLTRWGREEVGIPVFGLAGPSDDGVWGTPPSRRGTQQEDELRMRQYYAGLIFGRGALAEADESPNGILPVVQALRKAHLARISDLSSMASRTLASCWWPFTQHAIVKTEKDVNVIDSAHGDFFTTYHSNDAGDGSTQLQRVLDGSASWWTQCFGHADASLTYAATRAAGRYGHVLFPMCTSEPALRLSETLLGRNVTDAEAIVAELVDQQQLHASPGKGWASKVFFSDDGSTGMEVALKMAIASSAARYQFSAKTEATKSRISPGRQPGYQGGRPTREWRVLGLKGSYHGDTIGAMDACEGNIFNDKVHWYRGRGDWLEPPKVGIRKGKVYVDLPAEDSDWKQHAQIAQPASEFASIAAVYDVQTRVQDDPLYSVYLDFLRRWIDDLTGVQGHRYGALILEPLVMGAGGMIFVDPLFQRAFVDVVRQEWQLFARTDPPLKRPALPSSAPSDGDTTSPVKNEWKGLPIIFDEVFTGLYRLGYCTPAEPLGIRPDISVLAKILTGGMVPMSVTLATESIFQTFSQSEQKADALLHGHSYTAHPIGCEVARETLKKIDSMEREGAWAREYQDWQVPVTKGQDRKAWSMWAHSAVMQLSSLEKVEKVMALGTVLVVELKEVPGAGGYSSTASVDLLQRLRAAPDGPFAIHARPLGNVIYFMCSLNTPEDVRRKTEQALLSALQ